MKILFTPDPELTPKQRVTIEHNGEKIHWSIRIYDRTELSSSSEYKRYDAFLELNNYWNTLSIESQDRIFALYKQIKPVVNMDGTSKEIINKLRPLVFELLDQYHAFGDIRVFMNRAGIYVPPNRFNESFDFSDNSPKTHSKTYLREDYRNLVTLAVCLRTMIPIWSEFIANIKDNDKKNVSSSFKEYEAFKLISGSNLTDCPAMSKLLSYVNAQLSEDKDKPEHILLGISSEDYPEWILAQVLCRRVCIGNIDGVNDKTNIVNFVYLYISQKSANKKRGGGSFNDTIRDKNATSGAESDDNSFSIIEGYKIIHKNSIGDMEIDQRALMQITRNARMLAPNVTNEMIEAAGVSVKSMSDYIATDDQLMLTKLVLSSIVSPYEYSSYRDVAIMAGIQTAVAVLIARGYYQLAAICSGVGTPTSATCYPEVRKLSKDTIDKLRLCFPIEVKDTARSSGRLVNPAVECIRVLGKNLHALEWRSQIPFTDLGIQVEFNQYRFPVPVNFGEQIAELVIKENT